MSDARSPVNSRRGERAKILLLAPGDVRKARGAHLLDADQHGLCRVGRRCGATDIQLFEAVFGTGGERAIRVADRTPEGLARGVQAALELPDGGASMGAGAKAWDSPHTWASCVAAVIAALDGPGSG